MKAPGLFGRTAALVGGAILAFALIAWGAVLVFGVLPGMTGTADLLATRARGAITAAQRGELPPDGARLDAGGPSREWHLQRPALTGLYLRSLRNALRQRLPDVDVRIVADRERSVVWIRPADPALPWVALPWSIAPDETPHVLAGVLIAAALVVFLAATLYARRLAAPLRALSLAAAAVARGDPVRVGALGGVREFDALGRAFDAMAEQLRDAEARRELMLAGISHDLRTPLTRMRFATELLPPAASEMRDSLIRDIEELDALVSRFMRYVRAGYAEEHSLVSADEVVARAIGSFGADPDILRRFGAARAVHIAPGALAQIVVNLVDNALQHGALPVTVTTALADGELRVEVGDRGAGVEPADWERLLAPFTRGEPAPASGHTGLGLATVARLVAACGGRLAIRNGADGFVVEVRLPTGA